MAEEKKLPRLGAAAKEFNVSTGTIVDLLKKAGMEIEDNRNVKLTAEMYEVLVKKLSGEKKVKEDSQKLDMDFSYNKPGANKTEPESKPAAAEEEPEQLLIKSTTLVKETIKVEINKPKVVGKIDLEPKKKPASKLEPEKVETPAPQEEPVQPAEEPHQEPEHIGIDINEYKPKVVGKIDVEEVGKKPTKEPEPAQVEPEPEAAPSPEPQEEPAPEPEKPAAPAKPVPEKVELKVEKLNGPNIIGKIDLSTIKDTKRGPLEPTPPKRKRKRIQSAPKPQAPKAAKKVEVKPEVSQEDIDRQIKETLKRLEPQGKTKSSKRRREKRQERHEEMMQAEQAELAQQRVLKVTEFITANELSTLMNIPVTQIISTCMSVGLFVSINQRLSAETISLLAEEFGYEVEFVGVDDNENNKEEQDGDKPEDLQPRHPIITVMGHVDHGKTSLLDYIRKSNVIAGEAGGITQHIGAYEVTLADGRKITFLDTPGHEAFTAMRARGAKITDLCIIVIAADDSIMPQTVEAINHAQAAGVPMVFAITKIDKPHAAPDKIREGLANMNILVEEWGGKYQCQEIDAKHGTNVNELLEKVLLEAEMLDLKANPNRPGVGTVIESSLDKGKGYVAKLLVQNGTLKIGDPILAGSCYGKVKALFNERNQPVKSVGPASPVLLLGLDGAPQAGDTFKVCESEQEARSTATKRARLLREQGLRTQKHITLDEIGRRIAIGDFKELNVIVKGDVDGSVEALSDSLMKLSTDKIQVNVIHKSVGQVTESDVMLASASDAVIVAFQVRPSIGARKEAEKEQIDIRTYSIIYDAIEEIKAAMESMLAPQIREKIVANLEIKEVFKIGKVGNVAGCMVLDGKLQRSTKVRLIRDGIVIYTGKLGSLRRFKDDVKEVVSGQDCGLNIENYNDIKVGDIIEGYEEYEEKATL